VNGEMWEETRRLSITMLQTSYTILQHIVNGLFYIHAMGEVHRDLTPHNGIVPLAVPQFLIIIVLFKNGCWKLADFGLTSAATSNLLVMTSYPVSLATKAAHLCVWMKIKHADWSALSWGLKRRGRGFVCVKGRGFVCVRRNFITRRNH
jgi:serine/threonine protein kinase